MLNCQIGHCDISFYDISMHKKTFAVIRCPIDRLISCYNYFKMEKSFWHDVNIGSQHPLYNFCNNHNFEKFVDAVCNNNFDNISHLRSQVSYLKNNKGEIVSNLINFKRLNEDLSKLIKREIKIPVINSSFGNKFEISKKTQEKIINNYKEDWDLYQKL